MSETMKGDKMDEIDEKILEVLKKNARMPYKKIARHAKISDVAVHKRIKKLEAGIIKAFTVIIDQKALGKEITAIVAMQCEAGMTAEIAEALKKIEDATEVYTTIGEYDVIMKIRTKDTKTLREIVEKELTRIKGIREIRASIVFSPVKEDVSFVMESG